MSTFFNTFLSLMILSWCHQVPKINQIAQISIFPTEFQYFLIIDGEASSAPPLPRGLLELKSINISCFWMVFEKMKGRPFWFWVDIKAWRLEDRSKIKVGGGGGVNKIMVFVFFVFFYAPPPPPPPPLSGVGGGGGGARNWRFWRSWRSWRFCLKE